MNVLAIEPWYSGSHRHFVDGLVAHSAHDYRLLTMEGRFWRWRLEGAAVTMARKALRALAEGFEPDVVFASDMLDVPAFLALVRPHLGNVPVVLYLHENQLTYPLPEGRERERCYAQTNYLSALAADRVVFNSRFHHDEFLEALPVHLRAFPDYTHLPMVQTIREKSEVLHLGIDLRAHDAYHPSRTGPPDLPAGSPEDGLVVLWNQRWDYDKNPEAFFRTMNRLDDAGYQFRLILAGEHFMEQPPAFVRAFERYAERVLHYGYAEDFAEYSRLLHHADVVVSTSIHEFFGVAIMEAIYCGCHPLLPNRLSYPELVPDELHRPLLHAPVIYEGRDDLFHALGRMLSGEDRPLPPASLREIPGRLDWRDHAAAYDQLLKHAARSRPLRPLA